MAIGAEQRRRGGESAEGVFMGLQLAGAAVEVLSVQGCRAIVPCYSSASDGAGLHTMGRATESVASAVVPSMAHAPQGWLRRAV